MLSVTVALVKPLLYDQLLFPFSINSNENDVLFLFQCLVFYWEIVGPRRFKLNSLINFPGKFIYIDNTESSKYNKICEESVKKLVKNVVIVISFVILAHAVVVVGPIYAYIFKDIHVTPFATHLPFVEKDSHTEFILNLAPQSVIALSSMIYSITVEIMTCLIDNTISTIPKLIRFNLEELAKMSHKKNSLLILHVHLRNVLIQVQDYNKCVFILTFLLAFDVFTNFNPFCFQICQGCERYLLC